jgi:NADH:ubiquinone oxidoreductase subunit B-like Fe-S oxidoreductase
MSQQDVRREVCPDNLFNLAKQHQQLKCALDFWREGCITWEDALAYAIVLLCAQIDAHRSSDDRTTTQIENIRDRPPRNKPPA